MTRSSGPWSSSAPSSRPRPEHALGHGRSRDRRTITGVIRYIVDQDKIAEFEVYSQMWLELMPRFGGTHQGNFLPSEGESDIALSLFSFPSLAACEDYRRSSAEDPAVSSAIAYANETRCIV